MDINVAAFWMSLIGLLCWGICFRWMHLISTKQNALLDKLQEQGKRIESLSQAEHDLIKEVHPQVGQIKEGVQEMIDQAKEKEN